MKVNTNELIKVLIEKTRINLNRAIELEHLSAAEMNYKASKDQWSILECIEHLNLYDAFYIPAIKETIEKNNAPAVEIFKSGWLGNYFVNSMLPKEKLNKMKTFADKNPLGSNLDKSVIDKFIKNQKIYLELIDKSRNVNLNKAKTAITISKYIKLKLGDTFRFVIAHIERHLLQVERIRMTFQS